MFDHGNTTLMAFTVPHSSPSFATQPPSLAHSTHCPHPGTRNGRGVRGGRLWAITCRLSLQRKCQSVAYWIFIQRSLTIFVQRGHAVLAQRGHTSFTQSCRAVCGQPLELRECCV